MSLRLIGLFFAGLVVFVLLESLWLGVVMKQFYASHLKDFVKLVDGKFQVRWSVAFATWFLLVLGIFIFVKPHQISIKEAAIFGGLYGLVVYGVYDLTNYAMMPAWPQAVVFIDIAWGIALNAIVSVAVALMKKFF